MTGVVLQLADGTQGEVAGFDGKLLSIVLPCALAPGQPTELRLMLQPELALAGRSIGSRVREDGRFDVRLRLVNLTREARLTLLGEKP